jgi:KaiC/GvpD/RAD55 family RecA-like ATPase
MISLRSINLGLLKRGDFNSKSKGISRKELFNFRPRSLFCLMVSTGIPELDKLLSSGGYPSKSTILIVGPAGIGKEALGYWFTSRGTQENDFCFYITNLSVSEVLEDQSGFGISDGYSENALLWMASEGGQLKCDINDLTGLSSSIKNVLRENSTKRIRIVTDVLSPLLMLNPPETVYRFLSQLFIDLKQFDAVLLATIEDEMHPPQTVAAMEQKFDGVIELKLYEKGIKVMPLLRVRKMRGIPPNPKYFRFSFLNGKMVIQQYDK